MGLSGVFGRWPPERGPSLPSGSLAEMQGYVQAYAPSRASAQDAPPSLPEAAPLLLPKPEASGSSVETVQDA